MTSDIVGALAPGTQLLEYVIEGVLGHGGFGITYLARDSNLDKVVALKEYLPADLAVRVNATTITVRSSETEEAFRWGKDNFLKEARVLARFSNPNIIQVHRFFEANGTAYFVMEYAQGTTLAKDLKKNGSMDEQRISSILMPILSGLEFVHRAGVLHRDIKPDNIILRSDGSPVLIDFGASKQNIGSMTRSVLSVLTAGYAPLEQYASSGNQGPWTDLYAMGAVAYRCITGKKPVESVNRLRDDPLLPATVVGYSRYSPHFLAAVDWALAVNGEDRPQCILEWREALEGKRPIPAAARAPAPPPPADEAEAPATAIVGKRDLPSSPSGTPTVVREEPPAPQPVRIPIRMPAEKPAPSGRGPLVWVAAFIVAVAAGVGAKFVTDQRRTAPAVTQTAAKPAPERAIQPARPPPTGPASESPARAQAPAEERKAARSATVEEPAPAQARPALQEQARPEPQTATAAPTQAPPTAPRQETASAPPENHDVAAPSQAQPQPAAPAPAQAPAAKAPAPATSVGQMAALSTFQDCPRCPAMTVLPPGSFQMGSAPKAGAAWEMPQHTVRIARPLAIGKHEVTAAEWKACVEARACAAVPAGRSSGDPGRAPVVNVNWDEARAYTEWLSRTTGRRYRLPSEAEWEYATRAGTTTARFWGEDRRDQCLYANAADEAARKVDASLRTVDCNDGAGAMATVGSLRANKFRLFDLAGNAWEWTLDCWQDSYAGAPADGRAVNAPNCTRRVMRGGSWRSKAESLRSANRGWSLADKRVDEIGLRVVAE